MVHLVVSGTTVQAQNGPGAFGLLNPADEAELPVQGEELTTVEIAWEEAAVTGDETVLYTWHLDVRGGDFSEPLASIDSDNNGSATQLTLTVGAIDRLLATYGLVVGDVLEGDWTVTATAGETTVFANEPFAIDLERGIVALDDPGQAPDIWPVDPVLVEVAPDERSSPGSLNRAIAENEGPNTVFVLQNGGTYWVNAALSSNYPLFIASETYPDDNPAIIRPTGFIQIIDSQTDIELRGLYLFANHPNGPGAGNAIRANTQGSLNIIRYSYLEGNNGPILQMRDTNQKWYVLNSAFRNFNRPDNNLNERILDANNNRTDVIVLREVTAYNFGGLVIWLRSGNTIDYFEVDQSRFTNSANGQFWVEHVKEFHFTDNIMSNYGVQGRNSTAIRVESVNTQNLGFTDEERLFVIENNIFSPQGPEYRQYFEDANLSHYPVFQTFLRNAINDNAAWVTASNNIEREIVFADEPDKTWGLFFQDEVASPRDRLDTYRQDNNDFAPHEPGEPTTQYWRDLSEWQFASLEIEPFALTGPDDGAEVLVEGDELAPVVITWEATSYEGDESVSYIWHLDVRGEDFSEPLVSIPSDNEGSEAQLTLTLGAIDRLLATYGLVYGDVLEADWTVTAHAGETVAFADEPFAIDLERGIITLDDPAQAPDIWPANPVIVEVAPDDLNNPGALNQAIADNEGPNTVFVLENGGTYWVNGTLSSNYPLFIASETYPDDNPPIIRPTGFMELFDSETDLELRGLYLLVNVPDGRGAGNAIRSNTKGSLQIIRHSYMEGNLGPILQMREPNQKWYVLQTAFRNFNRPDAVRNERILDANNNRTDVIVLREVSAYNFGGLVIWLRDGNTIDYFEVDQSRFTNSGDGQLWVDHVKEFHFTNNIMTNYGVQGRSSAAIRVNSVNAQDLGFTDNDRRFVIENNIFSPPTLEYRDYLKSINASHGPMFQTFLREAIRDNASWVTASNNTETRVEFVDEPDLTYASFFRGELASTRDRLDTYREENNFYAPNDPGEPTTQYWRDLSEWALATPDIEPFALLSPEDGAELTVAAGSTALLQISWERPETEIDEELRFTWLLDARDGDFSDPLASFTSNSSGTDAALTLASVQIYSLLVEAGIQPGEVFEASWTVKATASGSEQFAEKAFDLDITRFQPVAEVQLIHNAADPAAASVDIYANNAMLAAAFGFREATPFVELPSGVAYEIEIYPAGADTSASGPVYSTTLSALQANQRYAVIANGVIADGFAQNPDDIGTMFNLHVVENPPVEAEDESSVAMYLWHGVTDAPSVDIWTTDPVVLANGLSYTESTDVFNVAAAEYTVLLGVEGSSAQEDPLYEFLVDLSDLGGGAAAVLASGFLAPEQNGNGEPLALLAVLPDGTTVLLDATFVSSELVAEIPLDFSLEQNYPNPFNPTTNIAFSLPQESRVVLEVYNLTGQRIATLLDENRNAGTHQVVFDGARLASGVYLYRLQAGDFVQTRKLMLVK